ncbi:hypothetical protein LguiB_013958 [Lonicera macranthoides]
MTISASPIEMLLFSLDSVQRWAYVGNETGNFSLVERHSGQLDKPKLVKRLYFKKRETPSSPTLIVNNTTSSTSEAASAADLVGEYDVFLSFRGADTRNGFTDHLYNNLVGAGVRTFRDNNDLQGRLWVYGGLRQGFLGAS